MAASWQAVSLDAEGNERKVLRLILRSEATRHSSIVYKSSSTAAVARWNVPDGYIHLICSPYGALRALHFRICLRVGSDSVLQASAGAKDE